MNEGEISDFDSQLCCSVATFPCERWNRLSVCFLCSFSFEESLKLLGLDDSFQEGTSDPVVTRGAYLSLIHLRHLKVRQLQVKIEAASLYDAQTVLAVRLIFLVRSASLWGC